MQSLTSVVGIAVILGIAVVLSSDRRSIRLRTVGVAFLLQTLLAALVLFVMTFVLNTVAESVRLRYRRKAVEL